MQVPLIATAQKLIITAVSSRTTIPMDTDISVFGSSPQYYYYVASTASWLNQGGSSVVAAPAATGALYVPAGVGVPIDVRDGLYIAVVRESSDGVATLTKTRAV